MERIITNIEKSADYIIEENEKLIANILHDIKSPLYSIKIARKNKLDSELNCDIYETVENVTSYIDNFLLNYSFKLAKFDNKITKCDVKELINKKIDSFKHLFICKNIHIDIYAKDESYKVNTILIFLSSILGNIISNIALHSSENKNAEIDISKKGNFVCVDFKNYYDESNSNFSLGLDFCKNSAQHIKAGLNFSKTKNEVLVSLKIPDLKS